MNSKFQNKYDPQSGFTLLEVLIAMAVLVFISFAVYQATIETYRLRDTLSAEGEFHNGIHLATSILQRDITMLYSPSITLPDKKPDPNTPPNPQQMQVIMSDDLGQTYTYWSPAANPSGLRPSHFI